MKQAILILVLALVFTSSGFSQELNVGDKAPEFNASADNGKKWDVKKYLGKKNIVVYFYPAAMTGGCTKQACAYRDFKSDLKAVKAEVVGISGDNIEGLKLFKKAYDLNFTLLSDETGEIATKFGVTMRNGGTITRDFDGKNYELVRGVTTSRTTFIIDKSGKIAYKNTSVDATKDTEQVLEFIKNNTD